MNWTVTYHRDVEDDLKSVGQFGARRIMRAIDTKLKTDPLRFGAPLLGNLVEFRKLRVGDYRVVYRVVETNVIVYVLAKKGQI